MSDLEIKEENEKLQAEYAALKKQLGELLLEHNKEDSPEDVAYYTRKFEETRKRLKKTK